MSDKRELDNPKRRMRELDVLKKRVHELEQSSHAERWQAWFATQARHHTWLLNVYLPQPPSGVIAETRVHCPDVPEGAYDLSPRGGRLLYNADSDRISLSVSGPYILLDYFSDWGVPKKNIKIDKEMRHELERRQDAVRRMLDLIKAVEE